MCIYIYIYIYTHIHTYISLSLYIYIYMYIHVYTQVYMYNDCKDVAYFHSHPSQRVRSSHPKNPKTLNSQIVKDTFTIW